MPPPLEHAARSHGHRRCAEDITLSHAAVPDVTLHYTRFGQIADVIDDALVYGRIHFRFDQEVGGRLGRRVGSYVYRNNLRRHG